MACFDQEHVRCHLPRTSPHTAVDCLCVLTLTESALHEPVIILPRALQQAKRQELMETLPSDDIDSESDDDGASSASTTRCVRKCMLRVSAACPSHVCRWRHHGGVPLATTVAYIMRSSRECPHQRRCCCLLGFIALHDSMPDGCHGHTRCLGATRHRPLDSVTCP